MGFPPLSAALVALAYIGHLNGLHANRSFTVDPKTQMFMKDGQPFRYVSGGMHYFRVPREYWRDRLHKLRAMGANAVQTYIEWSFHEPHPGVFNFEGDADIFEYIKLAQEEGLLVIIRAGPFICAERNMGGHPYWLLRQNSKMKLRTYDIKYMTNVRRWLTNILSQLKPYLYVNGGPIIMMQVENEYSLYGCNAIYLAKLVEIFDEALGKDQVVYFTTDPARDLTFKCGHINSALSTVDFGYRVDPAHAFGVQRKYDSITPFINSEFYTGWLDQWSKHHQQVSSEHDASSLNRTLAFAPNSNVNLYMFHGGTSFGFGNGAADGPYLACPTSYDYDAPCSEAGDLTDKYFALRDVIISYLGDPHVEPPPRSSPKLIIPTLKLQRVNGSLLDLSLSDQVSSAHPMTFEQLDQPNGFIIYSHTITLQVSNSTVSDLTVPGIHDRAIVYVNRVKVGVLSRMSGKTTIGLRVNTGDFIQLIVEDMGRVASDRRNSDYKGLGEDVKLGDQDLLGWSHQNLPLYLGTTIQAIESMPTLPPAADLNVNISAFYKGQFTVEEALKDTFVHLPGWKKGVIWINGFNLGRYWPSIGPQQSLYLPGCKLVPAPGVNTLLVLELESAPCNSSDLCIVQLLDNHIIDGPVRPDDA